VYLQAYPDWQRVPEYTPPTPPKPPPQNASHGFNAPEIVGLVILSLVLVAAGAVAAIARPWDGWEVEHMHIPCLPLRGGRGDPEDPHVRTLAMSESRRHI
jgi:hypothetical protein